MPTPPRCANLGPQCQELPVTLRVAGIDGGIAETDHEATWLLGHTQRISFDQLRREGEFLFVDAILHLPCRYLNEAPGRARCSAHGFEGRTQIRNEAVNAPRRLGGDRFLVAESGALVERRLPGPLRALPLAPQNNPCHGTPCRTADNTRGSACCRDLQVEIMCDRSEADLEALVRSRRSPYLCKIDRVCDESLEAEVISACGYLDDQGEDCTLHNRLRPDGRAAKPELCSEFPGEGEALHPKCVFRTGTMVAS